MRTGDQTLAARDLLEDQLRQERCQAKRGPPTRVFPDSLVYIPHSVHVSQRGSGLRNWVGIKREEEDEQLPVVSQPLQPPLLFTHLLNSSKNGCPAHPPSPPQRHDP